MYYRESHSKELKVILIGWGYRFWFFLRFWILGVHKIGPFMQKSLVFMFLMLHALYQMISKIRLKGQKSKSISSSEQNYFKLFAMRYPVPIGPKYILEPAKRRFLQYENLPFRQCPKILVLSKTFWTYNPELIKNMSNKLIASNHKHCFLPYTSNIFWLFKTL